MNKSKRRMNSIGFLGFLGFSGFRYFWNHDFSALFMFSFFAFFAYFLLAKKATEMSDERFRENMLKARANSLLIPALAVFLIGFLSMYSFMTKEMIILISALGWALTFLVYALLFLHYERS